MALTALQRAIVLHEVARKLEGADGAMMNVTQYTKSLGISRETYYAHLKKAEVAAAVEEISSKAEDTKDYAALVFRQTAIEALVKMITDKNTKDADRRAAIKDLLSETQYADVNVYEVPYSEWSDEDLLNEALARHQRLGLTAQEVRDLAAGKTTPTEETSL